MALITDPFIPLQSSQLALLKGEKLISDLLGQTAYEVSGNDVIFNKDLTIDPALRIIVQLIVFDINSYDDYTTLPIPSDMEGQVVMECVKFFAAQVPSSKLDDPSAEQNNKK